MKKKLISKQKLPWILLLLISAAFVILFINRYLLFEKTINFFNKVNVVWMGNTTEKVVALTFDDGPDPLYTTQILTILQKEQIPATFFLVGRNVQKYPLLVRKEIINGHTIGGHTFSHPRLSTLSVDQIRTQLDKTDGIIQKISGKKPLYFRSPYEELNENILRVSYFEHKQIILSTITLEHALSKTPKAKAERVIRMVFPGAIILAHDGRLNRHSTVQALPYLIEGLQKKGYRFVSLPELLRKRL
jgi:peptidoglycan/xylan/chitin deacetylase (PgdA/CDA1 family)